MTLIRALAAYRVLYVAFIVWASAKTILDTHRTPDAHAHAALFVIGLASVEILSALALLWRRTEIAACGVLLAVYATAAILSAAQGDTPVRFAYYAATAGFIVYLSRREMPANV